MIGTNSTGIFDVLTREEVSWPDEISRDLPPPIQKLEFQKFARATKTQQRIRQLQRGRDTNG